MVANWILAAQFALQVRLPDDHKPGCMDAKWPNGSSLKLGLFPVLGQG